MAFILERRGEFDVNRRGDQTNRCGSNPQRNRLFYRIRVTVDLLDGRGFVVKHEDIHDFLHRTYTVESNKPFPSCERIAQYIARKILDMANARVDANGNLLGGNAHISVRIGQIGGLAHVTCHLSTP